MNLIVIFDLITFCTSLAALIILLIGWKRALSRDVKLLTAGLFVFTSLYSFCLVLEWSGITSALDPFEDLIGALIPMWWAFIFYSFLQQIDSLDLRQSEEALQKAHDELERRVEERTRELDDQKNRLRFLSSRLIKAQEQERRRVSKGLHDEMGQALAILKLRLRSIQRDFPEGQSTLKEEFDDTAQHVDQIIETVRRLSKDLSPAILEDLGLSSALEWLIENFGKQHSIRTSVEMVNIDHLFSQETQTNLYRIFQEALTNIVKHARAGHVSFAVKKEEKGSVFFLIKDNGKGFDVNEAVSGNIAERGMGLTAMNERAYMMGAILDIQSRPGEGTRITLEIST
jgi:signal transduction histidine kinase